MKKLLLGVAISTLISSTAFAQIPVTDVASISQGVTQQVETITKWKMQYDQMIRQIDQSKQQFDSMNGSRGMGNIMNDPQYRDYLPADWQGVYDSVRNGGYNGLSGRGQSVYNATKIFDSCANIRVQEQRTACEARAVKASQDKGFALDAYDAAKGRVNQIDQLMGKIDQTQDPKAIAELQGRIAAEQANIQNEQTKLQLYAMVAAAEDKVQAQRQREIQAKTWNAKKGIAVQPLTFNN
jgi:type IV secretion system protein VirB5